MEQIDSLVGGVGRGETDGTVSGIAGGVGRASDRIEGGRLLGPKETSGLVGSRIMPSGKAVTLRSWNAVE